MPHKLRKIRKKRGSRTQGYGRVGQHRESGSKGERKAGRHKHGWSYVIRYQPDYFRKNKFKPLISPKKENSVINIGELGELIYKITSGEKTKKAKISLDLSEMGYNKLLGKGKINIPVTVKVEYCSEEAVRKIEDAGGQALISKTSPQNE